MLFHVTKHIKSNLHFTRSITAKACIEFAGFFFSFIALVDNTELLGRNIELSRLQIA